MYFSQNLDNIWTTSIKILSKGFRKFTDYTFKSKQHIYFIINTLYDIITPSKIPYSTEKCVILPNPNRITKISKAHDVVMRFFCGTEGR